MEEEEDEEDEEAKRPGGNWPEDEEEEEEEEERRSRPRPPPSPATRDREEEEEVRGSKDREDMLSVRLLLLLPPLKLRRGATLYVPTEVDPPVGGCGALMARARERENSLKGSSGNWG